jgi:hypothetical protein
MGTFIFIHSKPRKSHLAKNTLKVEVYEEKNVIIMQNIILINGITNFSIYFIVHKKPIIAF